MTARVDMKYAPTDSPEPLRLSRMPKLYIPAVEDRSGGFAYSGVGGTQSGRLTAPLADTARDAVRLEMARAGVPIADSRTGADAVLKAVVTAANEAFTSGGFASTLKATFGLSVQLRSLAGDLLWSNTVMGYGSQATSTPGVPGRAPTVAMNEALSDAMRKLRLSFEEEGALERVFRGAPSAPAAAPEPARAAVVPALVRSDVDDLPAARPESKRRHAVVIGVERYRENLPKADFAAGDARLAAEYFKRVLGVPEQNIAVLIDERAAKSDFEKYFERWLPNRVEAGDEVFVYFSGHGSPNPAKGDAYLVPYDGDPTYIDQTGYPLKRLYEQLSKLPAKSVTVAMDSCFSGAGGRSVLAKGARPLVTVSTVEALPAGITVLSASAGDQISNSYQEKGHGLFTYFLLKGLKERGADIKGVFEYLKPEVARTARRELNSDQDPQWRAGK
jgi:hypothetical protein